ncbi:MAG TPA: hypothetical protein VFT96_08835 [Gemmatimonadaceae bacterium]|jgi:hypothetical protein|nr:hypothetical protein [Gemmatimonadaceae bacterium]
MNLVDLVIAVVGCAALFMLFAAMRPAEKGCSGDCGSCTGTCPTEGGKH